MLKKVLDRVRAHQKASVDALVDVLKIDSISAENKNLSNCAEHIASYMRSIGLTVELVQTEFAPVIIAEYKSKELANAKTLMFYNHYDVQPPDPLELWKTPPFEPDIRDGRLYARGSNDNKGNLFARLSAFKAFYEITGGRLPLNVIFLAEGMEESGSQGFAEVIKKNKERLKADLCVWESGNVDANGCPEVVLGYKGIATFSLSVYGPSSDMHSSLGVIVENPAWRLVKFLSILKDENGRITLPGFYDDIKFTDPAFLEVVEKFRFNPEELKSRYNIDRFINGTEGEELKKRYFIEPALNINGIKTGYQGRGHKTVLPACAEAKLDFRLVPSQKPADIFDKLKKFATDNGFSDIQISDTVGYAPSVISADHKAVELVKRCAERAFEKEAVIYPISPASSPASMVSWLVPCISFGIGDSDSKIHAPNESISLNYYLAGQLMAVELMNEF